MSKRKNPVAITPRKKAALRPTFKSFGLKELIETETVDSKKHIPVELGSIFTYSDREGVICKICSDAKSNCDFARGKFWDQ